MQGVICGCDESQEWLLLWWWSRYSRYNKYPVTFYDFGMSQEAKRWCLQHGDLISVQGEEIASREKIDRKERRNWERDYGKSVWESRSAWFCKPFACFLSPYEQTVWVDLDCEILGSLEPLFRACENTEEIALVREFSTAHLPKFHPEICYNSGLISFKKGAFPIFLWKERTAEMNHLFWGDQQLLSHLIRQHKLPVIELEEKWNWRMAQGLSLHAHVYHWTGSSGKEYIRTHGGILPSLERLHGKMG